MKYSSILVFALLFILGGCFGATYTHPTKDDVDYEVDRKECRSICLSEYPADIEIQYSRAHLENQEGFRQVDVNRGPRTRCIEKCLREKGWKEN